MKVKQKGTAFKPITITIETEDELAQLYTVCNNCKITGALPLFGVLHDKLYRELNLSSRNIRGVIAYTTNLAINLNC